MARESIFLVKVLLIAAMAIAAGVSSPAKSEDSYTIRSIQIDATASDSSTARSEAIAEGQRRAFMRLLRKLTLPADSERIPSLPLQEISNYVQDFEISNERRSDQRYLAELTVRFKRLEIKRFLAEAGVPFSEAASVPIVILPIYRLGSEVILWEDANPWGDAWRRLEIKNELVNLIVPIGQLADVMVITAEQALQGDHGSLRQFASSYGAEETLVAVAEVSPTEPTSVDVTIQNFGSTVGVVTIERFEILEDETVSGLLERAVALMAERLEHDWKVSNLLSFDEGASLRVVVPIKSWSEWRKLISKLKQNSIIQDVAITELSPQEAIVQIKFLGEMERLAALLSRQSVSLERVNETWFLSVTREPTTKADTDSENEEFLKELPELLSAPTDLKGIPVQEPPTVDHQEDLFIE